VTHRRPQVRRATTHDPRASARVLGGDGWRRPPPRRGRARLAVIAAYVGLLLLVGAGLAAFRYLPALGDARQLRADLEAVGAELQDAGLAIDRPRLERVEDQVGAARERLDRLASLLEGDPLVGLARLFPPTANDVRGADAIVSAARDVFDASDSVLTIVAEYIRIREAPTAGGDDPSTLAMIVELMATTREPAAAASSALQDARRTIAGVEPGLMGPIENARAALATRLEAYTPLAERYVKASAVLPQILGWDEPRRYLVLAQNPAELRATGGFIGTYGIVSFDRGRITERTFEDVYLLDFPIDYPHIPEPPELAEHIGNPNRPWGLRDANWSPHFPTTARDARRLYVNASGDTDVDGVIGITTHTIDALLAITGPITVPDYDVTISAGETTLKGLELTRRAEDPDVSRKAFLSALADELIPTLLDLPPERWADVMASMPTFQSERLLLAWLADPAHQRLVAETGLNGAVRSVTGDYVYPVDTNVRPYSKLHAVTTRSLDLAVELDADGSARHALETTWDNQILEPRGAPIRNLPSGRGGDVLGVYFRLLVPDGSALRAVTGPDGVDATADAELSTEAGRTVIASYLRVPPGTKSIEHRWTTAGVAATADSGEYRLTIQKQPGLLRGPLSVTIRVPDGYRITSASEGMAISGQTATLAGTFERDFEMLVRYER
jgi:hypothetical protein